VVSEKYSTLRLLSYVDVTVYHLQLATISANTSSRASPRYPALMPENYSGQFLQGADLTGADLTGAILIRARLTGANLDRANFTDADLWGANLTRADLSGADFTGAHLTNAVRRPGISRADMDGALGLNSVKGLVD
jgi:hypothetical protein